VLAAAWVPAKKPRKKAPKQLCPVPGCKNPAAPVFGMVCADHKGVPKTKIKKYRLARRAQKQNGVAAASDGVKKKARGAGKARKARKAKKTTTRKKVVKVKAKAVKPKARAKAAAPAPAPAAAATPPAAT
jgi:hypothetical protein